MNVPGARSGRQSPCALCATSGPEGALAMEATASAATAPWHAGRMRKPLPASERVGANQSIVRAAAILQAVAASPSGISLSALARAVSLPSPTVSRLVHTLERVRLLARLPESREIVLGMGIAELGTSRVIGRELRSAGHPHVQELAARFGEAVELAQVVDDRADHLADALDVLVRVESTYVLRAMFASHGTIPVHATSVGKVLLAHRRPIELERVLASHLETLASGTVTDPVRLRQEIAEVQRSGVAFGSNEVEEGAAGLAVAIHGQRGDLMGILHVEGPSSRLTPERLKEIAGIATRTARSIEADFLALLGEQGAGPERTTTTPSRSTARALRSTRAAPST